MPIKNQAWNLKQGDGRQYALSSFTVDSGEFAKIAAYHLCGDDKIIVLELDAPDACSGGDTIASPISASDCCNTGALTKDNNKAQIGLPGRYILAREVSKCGNDIYAPQADVRVTKYELKNGVVPMPNAGFCPC